MRTVLAAHGAWSDSTLCWLIHTEPLCSALPTAVAAAVSCPHTEPVARRSLKRRLCTAEHLRTRERRCGGQPRHSTDTPPSPQRYPDSAACCLRAGSSARARARMRWDGAVRRSALSRGAKPTAKADGRVVHASHGIFHVAVAAAIAVQRLAAILRGQSATAAPCAMEHAWL